jgi:uncharacterized protein
MAVSGLAFRPLYGNCVPEDVLDCVVLRGEVEWIVEGGEAGIETLLHAVGALGKKVSAQSAILTFGNVVGTFDLGHYGVLRVRCGKWGEDVFDALLDDLTNRVLALPFSATQAAGLPHDRSIADRDDVLLHAFLYARHILLAADRSLPRALELVVRDPHRLFSAERAKVDLIAARRVDARTIARVAMGADGVMRATGAPAQSSLAHVLRGHLPACVDVPRVENTFDTAENRFVLEFLRQLRSIIDRVERLARSKAKPTIFWIRTISDCETMRRVLGPYERHDMWIDVGRMGHVPIGSSVLQRRRGYKDVLRHHLALRAAARIPFDRTTVEKLLGVKDVAKLYELWCYFAVVDAVRNVIGRDPDVVEEMDVKVDEVDLRRGFRVGWCGGPTVHYNLSFSRSKSAPRRSASLVLRPDIVIEVNRDGQPELHVFDAKLRIDGIPPSANVAADTVDGAELDESDDVDEINPLSFKKDDVAKMHAYRDALPHVRSARVLYPGNKRSEFRSLERAASDIDVVGALPLVPGQAATDLNEAIASILRIEKRVKASIGDSEQEPSAADLAAVATLLDDIERLETRAYPIDAQVGERLVDAISEHNVIVNFDWASWEDEAQRFHDPDVVRIASLAEVRRLLTLHVRKERFVEGHIAAMILRGHLSALLRRLSELVRAG